MSVSLLKRRATDSMCLSQQVQGGLLPPPPYPLATTLYKEPMSVLVTCDVREGFFALPVWGAYIWRGLYMEGLIFGILRYLFLCSIEPAWSNSASHQHTTLQRIVMCKGSIFGCHVFQQTNLFCFMYPITVSVFP